MYSPSMASEPKVLMLLGKVAEVILFPPEFCGAIVDSKVARLFVVAGPK
jgi:hypothetical protein